MNDYQFELGSINGYISKITNQISKKKGGKINILLSINQNWHKIIDQKIASNSFIYNLKFDKQTNHSTLFIKCHNSSVACCIENEKSNIIEKICSYYGYKVISDIKVKQF